MSHYQSLADYRDSAPVADLSSLPAVLEGVKEFDEERGWLDGDTATAMDDCAGVVGAMLNSLVASLASGLPDEFLPQELVAVWGGSIPETPGHAGYALIQVIQHMLKDPLDEIPTL